MSAKDTTQIHKIMILTFQRKLNSLLHWLVFLLAVFLVPAVASAQQIQSLSVSPTLFEMTANPTQEWSSMIRVINPNPYELTVYAEVVNFAPHGESGQGRFIPVVAGETEGGTLAEWLKIEKDEIVIPPEQTLQIPFSIKVPENAPPGGHFAALLVGTKPPENKAKTSAVETSQVVATLVFLRVTGNITEFGQIRSFRTTKSILEKPEATFELRFENKGNVHLQPRGEIKILNMWGQERGIIPVNRDTMFGNVLPDSVRNFMFTWTGQWSMADIGRYTAIATLAYGEDGVKFANSKTAFWVIPWKIISVVLLVLAGFVAFITWAIKLYIRRMLSMAGVQSKYQTIDREVPERRRRIVNVVAPIEAGILDLRDRLQGTTSVSDKTRTLFGFVKNYRIFFAAVVAALIFIFIAFLYIKSASVSERAYEVIIEGQSSEVKISSEDIAYDKLEKNGTTEGVQPDSSLPLITVVNRSGISGLGASTKLYLEKKGYIVVSMSNDIETKEENTIVVYDPDLAEEALAVSEMLDKALLSSYSGLAENEAQITVYVGKDILNVVQ